MFMFCRQFNQSLDDWNFDSVTYARGMLDGCTSFTHHDPSILIEQQRMYEEQQQQPQQPQQQPRGDAFEVHNKYQNFLPIRAEYLEIIRQPEIEFGDINKYVRDRFTYKIRELFTGDDLREKLEMFERAFTKVRNTLPTESPEVLQLIVKSINFVFSSKREPNFTREYLISFLDESCNAYAGPGDGTSCVHGIIERFVLAVGSAAETLCIDGKCETEERKIYKELDELMNIKFNLSECSTKWWEEEIVKPEINSLSPEDKKANFIQYLVENARRLNQYNRGVGDQIGELANQLDSYGAFKKGELGGSRKKSIRKSKKCIRKCIRKSKKCIRKSIRKSKKCSKNPRRKTTKK